MATIYPFLLLLVVTQLWIFPICCSRFVIINVGLISGERSDSRESDVKFWRFNRTMNILLEPAAVDVYYWNSVDVTRAVCSLLERGVHVLVSSPPHRLYPLMKSYSEKFHLPLVTASSPVLNEKDSVSLIPSSVRAVADVLMEYQWTSFLFVYDNDNGPSQLDKLLEFSGHKLSVEAFWRVSSADEVYLQLHRTDSPRTNQTRVVMATSQELVNELVRMPLIGKFHFILVDPVVEYEALLNQPIPSSMHVTKLTIPVNQTSGDYLHLENRWQTILSHLNREARSKTVPSSALYMNDIANVLEKTFRNLLEDYPSYNLTSSGVNCLEDKTSFRRDYYNTVNYNIRKVTLARGMTGNIRFSSDGQRTGFNLDVLQVTSSGSKKVGNWTTKSRLEMSRTNVNKDKLVSDGMRKIRVVSILGNGFLKLKNNHNGTGNDRFEGYVKDMLEELAKSLKWDYEIKIAEDGVAGELSDGIHWTGMMEKMSEQEADLAIGPIGITTERSAVVDFSKPFLTVGLTILLQKPDDMGYRFSGIGPIGMLRVWTYDVWLLLAFCYLVTGGATYAAARFTGDPDRIRSLETKMSDKLSPCSSFWFVIGILTFRGTGIYPKSVTFRLLSLVWAFFSLMILLFYISCLSSQLLKNRTISDATVYPRKTNDFLKNFLDKGYPKIGIWKGESLLELAEKGPLKDYKELTNNDESLIVQSYEEGVNRVRSSNGGFALITSSAFGQYVSGRQPCDTMITAGYLVQETYAIAFQKKSELREPVDRQLLNLTASGELRRLYEKWWYHNSSCVDPYLDVIPRIYSTSLTLNEVSGVFYFLIISICIVEAVAISEYFLRKKKVPVDD